MRYKKLKFLEFSLAICFFILFIFGARVADAATLYFSPSSENFTVGNIFTVNVLVNTENATINNIESTVNFPSDLLEVISFSKSGSIFSLWVEEPSFSNGAGTLSFNGGLPTPGFNGTTGKVLSVVFRVKKAGSATVIFSSPAIRANDGYGTNVFRTGAPALLNLVSEEKPLPSPSAPSPSAVPGTPKAPVISSSTHPDSTKWYADNNPVFKWDLPSRVSEVTLVMSTRANSPPIISYIPPMSEKILTKVGDGTWYLNARFSNSAGLGPITSFKFNIDTRPPQKFEITSLNQDDLTNPRPELLFESSDELSGLDHYEMKIGDGDWFTIASELAGKPYKLPPQMPGTREISVKAFDRAGNSTSSNTKIVIKPVPIPKPVIKEVILPKTKVEKVVVIKEEVEVVVKEVVVKGLVAKEVAIKEGVVVKVVAVRVDVLKLENSNSFGQISEAVKDAKEKLVKTVEVPIGESGNFEAKIDNLEIGTYIVRTYGKDERGAISDAFSDVVLKVAGESVLAQSAKWVYKAILRGFDSLVNFLSKGWFLIALGVVLVSMATLTIKKVVPFITDETRKLRFIASEYKSMKKLRKIDSKTKLELRILQKDIRDELDLLKKIASHRHLHPEEQYLKNKLEKYADLIKNMKE